MPIPYPRKILEQCTFVFVFVMVITGVVLSRTNLESFENFWVREDGPIEWATALALLVAAITNLYRIYILWPFRNWKFVLGLFTFALIFSFGFMEEISWGQRILGGFTNFTPPEFFQRYNTQGEMNLHNLQFEGIKINKLVFGLILGICMVLYFFVLPFLYRRWTRLQLICDGVGLPIPQHYHTFTYLALALLSQLADSTRKGELLEFSGCWIVLLMFFEPYNRTLFSRCLTNR